MEKFWSVFWKLFGISLLLAIIAGVITGLVFRSGEAAYTVVMGTIAAGFGLCGIIGLVVVPVEMFFEDRMNTAVLPGIAVPHGYCDAVGGIIGAAGFSRTGIEYGSPEPVHSVFMLIPDNFSRERHLRVLSRLLELFNSQSLAMIETAGSPREVYDILYRF